MVKSAKDMSSYSDTDRSTRGSNLIEGNSKVTRTNTARARQAETSGTQAQTRVRARSSSRTRTKASEKKPRGAGYSSADYSDDDDWGYGPRQHHRQRGLPDRRSSRLDSAVHTRAPYDRDSGYYGSTSAYPWNSSDYAFHGVYPGHAGPGQLVPTPYTGAIVPQVAPYQSIPGPLAPYASGPNALPPAGYYGNDQPAMTAHDGAVTVRKTRLPGADEKPGTSGNFRSLNDVDVVWNVSSTKDVTLHLELDVEDDIDTNLRQFILFTRRGDYKRAEQYYQDNLACHSEQPDVMVEYVRMLVEKGSYKAIRDLGIAEFGLYHVCRSPTTPKAPQAAQLLLLLHKAQSLSQPDLQLSYNALGIVGDFLERFRSDQDEAEEPQPLTSTMIQILLLFVDLAQTVRLESKFMVNMNLLPVQRILSRSLRKTYTDLLSNNHCWEIRDTIITSLKMFGELWAFLEIFPENSMADALSRLMADWQTMERDESTDLALLDILNYINGFKDKPEIWRLPPDPDVEIAHNTASDLARIVAASIKHNNPQLMKSRSYLEWLLLEEMKDRDKIRDPKGKGLTVEAFRSFPGTALSYTDALVYVPANSENPSWPVSASSELGDEDAAFQVQLLSTVRKAAQELGNYNLEAECLHELTCRSIEPESYLTELERFYMSVGGHQLSLLKTRLMRYLTVAGSDEKTRRLLKSQLIELDPRLQSIWRNFSHPPLEWAYRKVLYALMCSLGEGDTEQAMAVYDQGQAMIPLLPGWIRGTPSPDQYARFDPISREQYRVVTRDIPRRTFRSPSPPPPPTSPRRGSRSGVIISRSRARPGIDEERARPELKEQSVTAPASSEKIPTILETEEGHEGQKSATYPPPSETKPSRSRERLRPEPDREYLELKRQLEEHRHKQNEIIRKRAEEERLKELEREVRRKTQEEVHRMYEEKAKIAELARIERERARAAAEMEMKERLLREEEESRRRKRDEEELRARIKTEILEEFAAKERVKEEAMALEAKVRAEALQKFELERKAKKEAAALKRKAKKEQEAKEAEMYLEAEANAREKIVAELKAGIPRRRLRAILLGISDSEGSDFERRLIKEGAHSDSDSSVETRRRGARRHTRRSRRVSSSCSSCSNGDVSEGRRRRSESTRRVIVEHYRRSPGGTMHRIDVDSVDGDPENEVAVIEDLTGQDERIPPLSGSTNSLEKRVENEEQPQVESFEPEGFEESREAASPPEPERAPDTVPEEELERTTKVAVDNEEETEGQYKENGITTSTVPEGGQDSSDDLLIPKGAADDAVVDNENDLDIYD